MTAGKLQIGPEIYQSIGVRPLINCRGTFTVVGGSLELPEVRAAKDAAALHYVQLDELMDAVGRRLAELTGAEWGMVAAGCAAAIAHATTACVTGGNPDLHTRVPDLSGFAKDEVVIPRHSRNEYDQAIRSVGVRMVEVGDAAEYEAALGPKVAMVYVLAGTRAESGPLNYDAIYSIARKKNIPVLDGCRGRDAVHPERPSAARRHDGGLQRRQGDARPAVRRAAAGPQGSHEGGLGGERAAPWPWPHHEDRQGRDCRACSRPWKCG